MSDKPEALRLADDLEFGVMLGDTRDEAAAKLRRQHAEIEEWKAKAATWLASPEAAQRLEGYRELGRLVERAEAQRDAMRAELREATEAADDPAVNNLRTLPESIRMLRAERDALLKDYAQLQEALAWALEVGAWFNRDGKLEDNGCGCCSIWITPPEHLAKFFKRREGND